jgi:hypothetical protein
MMLLVVVLFFSNQKLCKSNARAATERKIEEIK